MNEIVEPCILGVAIASLWFYIRTMLYGGLNKNLLIGWSMVIVPMGIAIAFGIKVIVGLVAIH